jgi:hypothetical protein
VLCTLCSYGAPRYGLRSWLASPEDPVRGYCEMPSVGIEIKINDGKRIGECEMGGIIVGVDSAQVAHHAHCPVVIVSAEDRI